MRSHTIVLMATAFFHLAGTMEAYSQPFHSALSLKQCVETAVKNYLPVKESQLKVESASIGLKQAKWNMVPNLAGQINHDFNQGRGIDPTNNGYINQQFTTANYSLQSNATLFNGFRLLNSLKQSHLAYQASELEWQNAKDKLMLDVMLAYLQILNNEDQLVQANKQLSYTLQEVDRLEKEDKEGNIKPSDLYDLKGQMASDQVQIVNAQNSLNGARLSLAQLMNVPFDKDLEVEKLGSDQFQLDYNANTDSVYLIALQQLPGVKATHLRRESMAKALQASKGNLLPSLGFGAGYSTNFSSTAVDNNQVKIPYSKQLSNNYGTYLGIGLSIPILNNLRYRNQVAMAKLDLKDAQFTEETTLIQLRQNIEQDNFNMSAAADRYNAFVQQVNAYAESYRAAEVRFNSGVITSVDYLLAKNKLDNANISLINARYDYVLRARIMDYYQGRPLW